MCNSLLLLPALMTDALHMQAGKAQQKWEDIEGLKQQAERQQQDVAKAEAALAKARADLEGLPGLEESTSQNAGDVEVLKSEFRDLSAQVSLSSRSHKSMCLSMMCTG